MKFLYLFLILSILHAQDAEEFFKRGLKAYHEKDYSAAVTNFRKAYELDRSPRHKSALIRSLEKLGYELHSAGKYEAAARVLKDAVFLGSTEARPLYSETLRKLKELEREARRPPPPPKPTPPPEPTVEQPAQQPTPIQPPAPPVTEVKPRIPPAIEEQNLFLWFIGIIIAVVVITFLITYVLVRKSTLAIQSSEVRKYQEIILQMLQEKQMLSEPERKMLVTLPAVENQFQEVVVISPQARKKAKRIEIIERALQNEKRPEIAEQLLGPFLSDPNNRVRANAAKAIYRFNRRQALDTLKEMLESGDKWMIVSACWVFEQIKDLEGIKYIVKFLNDKDPHIKMRAFKAFEAILSSHSPREIERIKRELPPEFAIEILPR